LVLVVLFTLGMWFYRSMAAVRKEMYASHPGQFK